MKVAYIVMAHKNPLLLQRVIRALSSENCGFFIHVDRKSNIGAFRAVTGTNVLFSETRIPVYWGEFSQVEAICILLRQALKWPERYDYFVLLSGSDYPIRSGQYIEKFFQSRQGTIFMDLIKMPAQGKPLFRISALRYGSEKPIRRFAARALSKMGLAQRDYRKHLGNLEPYSGGTWALTRDACEYILAFMDQNPRVVQYFRHTFAPDEALFHTIIGNSGLSSRTERGLYFTDWSTQDAHPVTIDSCHVEYFGSQDRVILRDMYGSGEVLFARKFSDDRLDVVDQMDEMIRRKDECPSAAGTQPTAVS